MIGDITEREREREKRTLINPYNLFYKRNCLQKPG